MSEPRRLGGRFKLLQLAGKGASSEVYRALDETTGRTVAVKCALARAPKLLGDPTPERFRRERRLLESISSPHVVGLVGHGTSEDGQAFLAVDWLEGTDLARRQKDRPLDGRQIVEVLGQIASGLDAIHRLGFVHRDVKPANVFVADTPDGQLRATVIDLGIAWSAGEAALTHEGLIIGTPSYMSPEQILRDGPLTGASDQFSLGVLAYELVTGVRPYVGDDAVAVLAKIALTDPPRLRDAAPDVPGDLDAVVARAMAKEPAERYASMAELREALAAATPFEPNIAEIRGDADTEVISSSAVVGSTTLATGERRVVTAVFMRFAGSQEASGARAAFERAVRARGGVPHALLSLAHVGVFGGAHSTGDEPLRAASAALELIRSIPEADVVVATGRTSGGLAGLPADAVDRGARAAQTSGGRRRVRIDEATVRLLGDAFEIHRVGSELEIFGERRPHGSARTFLGNTSVCVGRDREIAELEALYAEAARESVARVAVVAAPPGAGKSRLRQELLSKLGARDDAPAVLLGHGNAIGEGATFGLVGSAIRSAAFVRHDDPQDERRRKIVALARNLGEHVQRALLYMADARDGETATASAELTTDRLRAAFEAWLRDLAGRRPVAVVLEDVHWADPPSVSLVDGALRNLSDQPIFVLALARPEVKARFPRLFEAREPQRLALAKLTRRASEALVRNVVGEAISEPLLERILARADGNAFHLEELVRAVAASAPSSADATFDLPDTVLATVQARLDALGSEAKRIIKAASIFGEAAGPKGVAAVLASDDVATVERVLSTLASDEVLEERCGPGESTFVFRHALLRDGAYELLLEEDRRAMHERAGEWLLRRGEPDALVLARHFELGGALEEAMPHYRRAAEHALRASDFALAVKCADKAVGAGAEGEAAGMLHLVVAESKRWLGDYPAAIEAATRASALLEPGSRAWFSAMREIIGAHGNLGTFEPVAPLVLRVWETAHAADAVGAKITALTLAATSYLYNGYKAAGADLAARVEHLAKEGDDALSAQDRARVHELHGTLAGLSDQLERARAEYLSALDWLDPAGEERRALIVRSNLAFIEIQLGEIVSAEATLRAALPVAVRLGVETTRGLLLQNLGMALRLQGRRGEALEAQTRALELFVAHKDARLAGWSRLQLAMLALEASDLERALEEARAVLEGGVEMQVIGAQAIVSRAQLLRGATEDSLASAQLAVDVIERVGCVEDFDIFAYVTLAEALLANGEGERAKEVLRVARAVIETRLAGIHDAALRESFVERVPDHARVYELCRAVLERRPDVEPR